MSESSPPPEPSVPTVPADSAAAPGPSAPPPSVVIDTNAKVKFPRWPLIVPIVVVAGLVAFTVVWFATRDDSPYEPGPAVTAFVAGFVGDGEPVALTDREMMCIDDAFADVDEDEYDRDFDPMDSFGNSAAVRKSTGRALDDCLDRDSRIELLAASLAIDGMVEGDGAACVAETFDASVVGGEGYSPLFADEEAMNEMLLDLFDAFEDCGVSLFDPGDPTFDEGDLSGCEFDFNSVSAAIEAYYASYGENAQGWDDLYPEFLLTDLSDRFTIEPGDDPGSVVATGIGECDGYSFSYDA